MSVFPKLRFFATAGICLVVLSCNKNDKPTTDFKINGIKDIALPESGAVYSDLEIELVHDPAEQVNLTITGMPKGMSASFNKATEKPNFITTLYIKDDSCQIGEYPITITGKSASGIVHTYTFTVSAVEKKCVERTAGTYHGTALCRDGMGYIFSNFLLYPDTYDKNKLWFYWYGTQGYALLNCYKNSFIIPEQRFGKYHVTAEGNMDDNYRTINFKYVMRYNNGDTVSCFAHFIKL